MRGTEIRAAGDLVGQAFGGSGGFVREMHEAVAGRTFRSLVYDQLRAWLTRPSFSRPDG